MGGDWDRLRAAVAATPMRIEAPDPAAALRLSAGILLYAALIWLHPLLFGVSPLP